MNLFSCAKIGLQAPTSVFTHNPTRVDEGRTLLKSCRDKNLKTRTVVGRGEECPLCSPMVDLRYEREGAGEVEKIWYLVDGMGRKIKEGDAECVPMRD